jgi:glycosyltransferase involved in cell wall biosynthesis
MEAMAFRVPVVANAVGGVVDYVLDGYTGVITRYNNVDDYVDAIMRISSDPALRKRITENAYELIETCYRPEQQVNAFERSLQ